MYSEKGDSIAGYHSRPKARGQLAGTLQNGSSVHPSGSVDL